MYLRSKITILGIYAKFCGCNLSNPTFMTQVMYYAFLLGLLWPKIDENLTPVRKGIWDSMFPQSPRPNKEWSLGWSMGQGFPTTKGQSLVEVDLDYLGVWNFFWESWKTQALQLQHPAFCAVSQAAKDGDHRVPWIPSVCFLSGRNWRVTKRHPELRGSKLYTFIYPIYVDTVDGSEILGKPVEVGSVSHYLPGFRHPKWCSLMLLCSNPFCKWCWRGFTFSHIIWSTKVW